MMPPDQITSERLAGWQKKLALENATPLALVGIGHGTSSGRVVLCITENGPSNRDIADMLRAVATNQLAP